MEQTRIMIVGAHNIDVSILESFFAGYEVIVAEDGRTALKTIMQIRPDIILMDAMMQGVDGFTALSIIKHTPEMTLIPVIVITSSASLGDMDKALDRGADGYISTPIDYIELRAKILELLNIKELREDVAKTQTLLLSISDALEARSGFFKNHGQRTAQMAVNLAKKELLNPAQQERIKFAALLHDIGNLYVEERILMKAGKLTQEEHELVKAHVFAGEKICSVFKGFKPILPYIRYHHEWFDGSGYPEGLKGKDIPFGARIISVADAYTALTSPRPYREAFSSPEALDILRANAGIQFDPQVVELIQQIL